MLRGYLVGVVFTLPLVANWVAKGLGWYIFYLTDPGFQWLWGTAAQVFAGIPLWAAAWRGQRRFLAAAVPGLVLYLYSLAAYLELLPAAGLPLLFDAAAVVLVVGGGLVQLLDQQGRTPGGFSGQG